MRGGRLDHIVVVQRFTTTQTPSGQPIKTWSAVGGSRYASKSPVSGAERFGSVQLEAKEQVEFRLRWADDLAELRPVDRIIEPASAASDSPLSDRSIYDIIAVHEIGRREGLRVLTARRP